MRLLLIAKIGVEQEAGSAITHEHLTQKVDAVVYTRAQ